MGATTDELEAAEIDVAIKDAVSDMHKKEETEMNKVENEMNYQISIISDNIKKVVEGYLQQKGLQSSDVTKLGDEIAVRLREQTGQTLKEKTKDAEEQMDGVEDELRDIVDEDKYIIERAKLLGLTHNQYNKKEVDVIEDDIESTKKGFDEYLNDVTTNIEQELNNSLTKVIEKIEKDVFQEKGIKLSDTELKDLVEKEKSVTTGS